MSSKRKFSAATTPGDSVESKRQRPNQNHIKKSHVQCLGDQPVKPIKQILSQLETLVQDVLSSSYVLEEYLGESGSGIVKAINELANILPKISGIDLFRTSRECGEAYRDDQHHVTSIHHPSRPKSLPPLPPIHDELLQRAVFTHSGVAEGAVTNSSAEVNYDRLEILGDAYLELLATRLIWDHFKGLPPGRISQIREDLVKNETLAGYATLYGFDTRAVVPKDYPSQAKRWTKTKADIFEAYVAAAILSDPKNGYQAVQSWLWQLWAPRISQVGDVPQALVNKETLAKKIMSKGIKVKYADIEPLKNLKGGTQTFTVGVFLTGWGWTNHLLGSGKGSNRAIAGDLAAKHALDNKPLIDQIAQLKQAHDLENKKAV